MRRYVRHRKSEAPPIGEDSFLDVISNMVGIMIILVMVAGVRVGNVIDTPAPQTAPAVSASASSTQTDRLPVAESFLASPPAEKPFAEENVVSKTRYVEAMKEFSRLREDGLALKTEVNRLNEQMVNVKNEAAGAEAEYRGLTAEIAAAEAAVERAGREKTDSEQARLQQASELRRLDAESNRLKAEVQRLAETRPKAKLLENMPTPLTKKVEGSEGVFALRGEKISHVPISYFAERVRGYFRTIRDLEKGSFQEEFGPYEGYTFRFRCSLHKVHADDGRILMNVVFDEGEFIPNPEIGETWETAVREESEFRKKLAMYLRSSSVITLSVYPDSFALLREVKKFLLENDYTIAIRPMPSDKNIIISPNGSESTTY
ncbi:MAG: hypothetical protein ACOX6D_03185 [Thermoguttaceae bacterium]|jgi:hypothetical protein